MTPPSKNPNGLHNTEDAVESPVIRVLSSYFALRRQQEEEAFFARSQQQSSGETEGVS